MFRSLHILCIALAGLLAGQSALAGEFSVTPVRIDFTGVQRSQLLAITNAGNAPARFLARPSGWTMNEGGGVLLTDDDSLLVFPQSFTIAPKATQNIRIGIDTRPGDTEKTWRVILEELPDPAAAAAPGAVINVLSIISVPVFMPPLAQRKAVEINWQGATGNAAKVGITNTGNVHQMLAGVTVTAMRGETAGQTAQQEGWYILPAKDRVYTFNADAAWCAPGVTAFELKVVDREGKPLALKTVNASEACR